MENNAQRTTQQRPRRSGESREAPSRVLLVVLDELVGPELIAALRDRLPVGEGADVRVIAPAVERTAFRHLLGDVDPATEDAARRLETSLHELERAGIHAHGEIGDGDPLMAIDDALRTFPADEVVIVAHAESESRWFEDGLFKRVEEELQPAVQVISIDHEAGERQAQPTGFEKFGPGKHASAEAKHEVELSANLPRFTRGDLAGIVVAIVGTIVVAVLAGTGPGPQTTGGAIQILVAIGVALINMAHVVGLTLFESVHYRGGFQRFFRTLSLTATPLAIVVNGLIVLLA